MKEQTTKREIQTLKLEWGEIHRKVEKLGEVLARGLKPTPEERKKILEARAKAIAPGAEKKEISENFIQILIFLLAYETYGIELFYIREVLQLKELTAVPCTPQFVLGIINVRGEILSVIDIKQFFDLPAKGLTELNKVIIIDNNQMSFGILADSIIGVRSIALEEIQPATPTLTGVREEYLKGVTKERLVILDAEKLLSDKKIVIKEEIV